MLRPTCPLCADEAPAPTVLADAPMDSGWVADYLGDYYRGRAESALLTGRRYRLLSCERCGLAWQEDAPDGALAEALYTRWLDIAATRQRESQMDPRARAALVREAAAVRHLVGREPSGIRVFEYGLGWSRWAREAVRQDYAVHGTDLSPEKCRHAAGLGVTVLDDAAWQAQRFDYIHCDQVLEHLPDPLALVRQLAACLNPGGWLLLGTPDGRDVLSRLRSHPAGGQRPNVPLMAIHPLEHVNTFTNASLAHLIRASGLELQLAAMAHLKAGGPLNVARAIKHGRIGTRLLGRRT